MKTFSAFAESHAAWVAGAGFLLLAAYQWMQGDMTTAGHDAMLALAAFGLKGSVEKVFSSMTENQPAGK